VYVSFCLTGLQEDGSHILIFYLSSALPGTPWYRSTNGKCMCTVHSLLSLRCCFVYIYRVPFRK